MSFKTNIKAIITQAADRRGLVLIPKALAYPWQVAPVTEPTHGDSPLGAAALDYLRPDNPRLVELELRYAAADPRVTTPMIWQHGYVTAEDLKYFRGDNAYRWALRGRNYSYVSYVVSNYYLEAIDTLGLFDTLEEDDAFGNLTYELDGRTMSNDLLDSICELNFLERHLQISQRPGLRILDIGAGYGRLAHRAVRALPDLGAYLCTDGVAVSSFLCEFYLRARDVADKARIVPLDEVEKSAELDGVDLAINIHSFSECRPEAIEWWVAELARRRVPHLLIAPNAVLGGGGRELLTNDGADFSYILARHGYRLLVREPKYRRAEVQELGFCPTHYHLFALAT
ncbi:putative sugar O-methyltransferase [Sphingomonas sp. AR_OL41]|jgi:hypothetical protein|uniref:putative sugar O-methyltransferase n=1 Tax=Sphingomonas sp. AR_OL41 TaxID=3042729 RepID=UPI00248156EE|nr:putative sugar O-methyltransferase [Sphingomonas sp. AR_OL41]MDH7974654.1 putative sugar O-methyltransferase [Sphingomonas sp. AR_OL41]